jgi:hypothetical protein
MDRGDCFITGVVMAFLALGGGFAWVTGEIFDECLRSMREGDR